MIGETIEKEQLGNYKIIPAVIDKTHTLHNELLMAQRLGNEFKSKATIIFQTEDGPKRVETTIWAYTDKYLHIKSGFLIPLNSIIKVDF